MRSILFAFGRGLRNGFVALGALALVGTAIAIGATYNLTQGSGTPFASVLVSAVNYAAGVICDPTAGIAQCATVNASGQLVTNVANTNANGQATMANSSPVVLASNQSVGDPCTYQVKLNAPIGTSGATNVQAVAGVAAKKVYICSISLVVGAAAVMNVIEGTGAACTTANEAAIIGSTTAANGMSLAANGGMTYGDGTSTIGVTATTANGVCFLASSSVQFGGNMTYVQQ